MQTGGLLGEGGTRPVMVDEAEAAPFLGVTKAADHATIEIAQLGLDQVGDEIAGEVGQRQRENELFVPVAGFALNAASAMPPHGVERR